MHSNSEMIFFTLSIYFKFQKICIPMDFIENWALISCVNIIHIPTYMVNCNINENVAMFKYVEVTQTNYELTEFGECLLPFSSESFVFPPAV
jgi:hypothetical protein